MTEADLRESLHRAGYIADEGLATTLWLAADLQRPLLIEGDADVGKTALAAALAHARGQALGLAKVSGQTRPSRNLQQLVHGMRETMDNAVPTSQPRASDAALDAPAVAPDDDALSRARGVASRTEALHDRSMETHAQLFLRIARAFVTAMNARVFVFHTRSAEVTPLLRRASAAVQEKVNAVTAGFGGGTRIATSIADFHAVHARAQLTRRARVWVLSDGFDADPPALLADKAQVRARGARITWFHPAPQPPVSQAMQHVVAHGG